MGDISSADLPRPQSGEGRGGARGRRGLVLHIEQSSRAIPRLSGSTPHSQRAISTMAAWPT